LRDWIPSSRFGTGDTTLGGAGARRDPSLAFRYLRRDGARGDKLVSLFETHADIIVNSRRGVQYGHKLNLTTGKSGMILDIVIEDGNPADAARFVPMLERHVAIYDSAPRQTSADGGQDRSQLPKASGQPVQNRLSAQKHATHGRTLD
jgi:IS5 family transposase